MSDADDQMGGEPPPSKSGDDAGKDAKGRPSKGGTDGEDEVDEASKESFPASDPPGNY